MILSSLMISDNWTSNDIIKVCRQLKNGKSRDENGLVYELFKPENSGSDLSRSLSIMFNKIKNEQVIPEFLQLASITSIVKNNRWSRSELSNQRGFFCVSTVRSILDKLIHFNYFNYIDLNLTVSNVGRRR